MITSQEDYNTLLEEHIELMKEHMKLLKEYLEFRKEINSPQRGPESECKLESLLTSNPENQSV